MKKLIIKFLSTILGLWIAVKIIPGVSIKGLESFVVTAVVMGIVNTFLKPILLIFTLPLTLLTLGAFVFVINGIIVLLTSYLVPGFEISSFTAGLLCSLVIFAINLIADTHIKKSKK